MFEADWLSASYTDGPVASVGCLDTSQWYGIFPARK